MFFPRVIDNRNVIKLFPSLTRPQYTAANKQFDFLQMCGMLNRPQYSPRLNRLQRTHRRSRVMTSKSQLCVRAEESPRGQFELCDCEIWAYRKVHSLTPKFLQSFFDEFYKLLVKKKFISLRIHFFSKISKVRNPSFAKLQTAHNLFFIPRILDALWRNVT